MSGIDWHELDLEPLTTELRSALPPAEAEKMIWAFDSVLSAARVDGELLRYLLAAAAALIARDDGATPRDVFEAFFRRSVSDEEWRGRYASLIA